MQAYVLLHQHETMTTRTDGDEIVKAADRIIQLAEQIKSERMTQIRQIGLDHQ